MLVQCFFLFFIPLLSLPSKWNNNSIEFKELFLGCKNSKLKRNRFPWQSQLHKGGFHKEHWKSGNFSIHGNRNTFNGSLNLLWFASAPHLSWIHGQQYCPPFPYSAPVQSAKACPAGAGWQQSRSGQVIPEPPCISSLLPMTLGAVTPKTGQTLRWYKLQRWKQVLAAPEQEIGKEGVN